jgi:hypothetical protein
MKKERIRLQIISGMRGTLLTGSVPEILKAVTMQSIIFRDVRPCSLVEIHRFGGVYCLCRQGRRVSQVNIQQEACGSKANEDGGSRFLRNVGDLPEYLKVTPVENTFGTKWEIDAPKKASNVLREG